MVLVAAVVKKKKTPFLQGGRYVDELSLERSTCKVRGAMIEQSSVAVRLALNSRPGPHRRLMRSNRFLYTRNVRVAEPRVLRDRGSTFPLLIKTFSERRIS